MGSRLIALVCALIMGMGTVSGCTSSPGAAERFPEPRGLTRAAAAGLDKGHTATLILRTIGAIPGFAVQSLDGVVAADATGHGEATVTTPDGAEDVEFTLSRDGVLIVDSDDRQTKVGSRGLLSSATFFDRSGALGTLLSRATALSTEGVEELDGIPTYRVAGLVSREVITSVLPEAGSDVEVKFWIERAEHVRVHRVWIQFPPPRAGAGATMLELGISEHDAPLPSPSSR